VGDVVARLIDPGAVGINIEDGCGTPDLLCAKIERAKRAGAQLGIGPFVNARTDVYLREQAPQAHRASETLARGKRSRAAGADGLFVRKVVDPEEIGALTLATDPPLNILAWPGLPSAAELAKLGVRRLSAGSAIAQALWRRAADIVRRFLEHGQVPHALGRSDAIRRA
jgi:2-methylisocitrate lyase-like PEP mutase family enzyme